MIHTIIWVEVLAMLVSLIVLYGNRFESHVQNKKRKYFSLYVLALTAGLVSDLISWIFEGQEQYIVLLTSSTLISFIAVFPAASAFIYYLYEHISAKQKVSRTNFEIFAILDILMLVVVLIDCLCGELYVFTNGVYETGPHYYIYLAMEATVYFTITWLMIRYRKILGWHDIIAIMSYIIFPLIASVANVFMPEYSFSYPSCTLSILLIYVMLQGEQERSYLLRERVITAESRQDELTGLLNRRAFTEMCDSMTGKENIGVVFCDANGLKYANDHFGHERGDQLLCDLAAMLRSCFRLESTFRISGDEFVILLPDIDQEAFENRIHALADQIHACPVPLAAIGTAFGSKSQLVHLVTLAEENMYQDKQAFYVRFPSYKRQ